MCCFTSRLKRASQRADIREFGQSIVSGWTRWPSILACIAAPWATPNPGPSAVVKTCVSFKLHFNQFIRSIDVCRWTLQFILCFCPFLCVLWLKVPLTLKLWKIETWLSLALLVFTFLTLLPTEAPIATLGKASNYRRKKPEQNYCVALEKRRVEDEKMFNFRFDVFIIVKPSEKSSHSLAARCRFIHLMSMNLLTRFWWMLGGPVRENFLWWFYFLSLGESFTFLQST